MSWIERHLWRFMPRAKTAAHFGRKLSAAECEADGLCYYCRLEPRDEGFKSCSRCRAWRTEVCRVRRATVPKSEAAKAKERARDRARWAEAKAEGKCTACRKRPADPGYASCASCREMHKVIALKSLHKRRHMAPAK